MILHTGKIDLKTITKTNSSLPTNEIKCKIVLTMNEIFFIDILYFNIFF